MRFSTAFKRDDTTKAVVMGRGLQTAMVLFHDPTARPDVPHVLIVVSYAPSADNFLLPSLTMRHDGIDIFGVGVDKYFSKMQLLLLTSIPKFRHLFKAKSSSQLKCLAASVADKVIRGMGSQLFHIKVLLVIISCIFTDIQSRVCPVCANGKLE